jgi:hypothetical protein
MARPGSSSSRGVTKSRRARSTAVAEQSPAPVTPPQSVATRSVDAQQRQAMIAEAAYLRAERRGFAPGREAEDWLAAEDEVNRKLLSP